MSLALGHRPSSLHACCCATPRRAASPRLCLASCADAATSLAIDLVPRQSYTLAGAQSAVLALLFSRGFLVAPSSSYLVAGADAMEQHVLRQDSLIAIARLSRNVAASSSSRVAARASSPWDFTHRCYLEPGVPCAARVAHRRSLTTTTLLRQCLLLDVVPNQGRR
jgi:hypothetical protein